MEKLKRPAVKKNERFKFFSARILKNIAAIYSFELTYTLYDKKMTGVIEHGNLFGEENEIESFSNWHLN